MTTEDDAKHIDADTIARAAWRDAERLFWAGSVGFILIIYALVTCYFIGDMYRHGLFAWVPANFGAFLAGALGVGGVGAAVAIKK